MIAVRWELLVTGNVFEIIITGLKIFFIETDEFQFDGPPSFLSKVTGSIAFKRHPELTVTLVTNSEIWRQGEFGNFELPFSMCKF